MGLESVPVSTLFRPRCVWSKGKAVGRSGQLLAETPRPGSEGGSGLGPWLGLLGGGSGRCLGGKMGLVQAPCVPVDPGQGPLTGAAGEGRLLALVSIPREPHGGGCRDGAGLGELSCSAAAAGVEGVTAWGWGCLPLARFYKGQKSHSGAYIPQRYKGGHGLKYRGLQSSSQLKRS